MRTTVCRPRSRPIKAVPQAASGLPAVTIREATARDAEPLVRLARLDSSRPLGGHVIVAEVGGELWAALSLSDGRAVADPFRPAGECVWLLRERARQMQLSRRSRSRAARSVQPSRPVPAPAEIVAGRIDRKAA